MKRVIMLLAFTACGTTTDDRPRTTEYVTKTVLKDGCGEAQCHSSFANSNGYAFDTVDAVKRTLLFEVKATGSKLINDQSDPTKQPLWSNLRKRNNSDPTEIATDAIAMPLDSPLPEGDVELLLEWLALGTPGACKLPEGTSVCGVSNHSIVTCGDEGEFVFAKPEPGECL